MVKVPSPGEFVDTTLLDRVFNPGTWWYEYNFGGDAMYLRLRSLLLGHFFLVLFAVGERAYVFLFLIMVSASIQFLAADLRRRTWVRNNKTGKNVARVTGFYPRMFDVALTIFVALPSATLTWTNLLFWVNLVGFVFSFVVTSYLDATDAIPPGYHERKTLQRFA